MAASLTDKITDVRNSARPNTARVTTVRTIGATNLACDSLTGWPTASKVHFVTYQVDTNSNVIPGTQLDCYGIVSANTITNMTIVDGTDGGNSVGDYVEMLPTAAWAQDLADALMTSHNRDGSLADDVVTTDVILNSAVTTAKINDSAITTAKIADDAVTSAKLVGIDKSNLTTDYNPYKFEAYIGADYLETGGSTWQLLNFSSEAYDTNNNFDTTTYLYTAPVNGYYFFTACYLPYIVNTVTNIIGFYKNGAEYRQGQRMTNVTGGNFHNHSQITMTANLSAGDTIGVWAWCNQGGTYTITGSRNYNSFSGFLISRT